MNIGIIGTGNIGSGLARRFVRLGHMVHLSNSRGPDSLKDLVVELGPRAEADSTANAVAHGEIVLLAMPWGPRHNTYQSAGRAGAFAGKSVLDAMISSKNAPAKRWVSSASNTRCHSQKSSGNGRCSPNLARSSSSNSGCISV